MSKSTTKKTASAGKGSPLLIGLLLGLILGVGIAAGLAWYLMKSPSPFVSKEPVVDRAQEDEKIKANASAVVKQNMPAAIPVSAVAAASGAGDGKPRFEFYKVLTDKQDAAALPNQVAPKTTVTPPAAKLVPPAVATPQPAAAATIYYLQAGAFSNAADAEKLKATLIFDGMEVTILEVNSPDKGLLHKVRVGPYASSDDMNSARAKLQLKGIESTPVRTQ